MQAVTLEDKYVATSGRIYLSGIQALVRLALVQRLRDAAAGLNTGGFISGYRGSPLGGLDEALWKARKHLDAHHIKFQPGVNEELAATAVWGTQQVHLIGESDYDGVFAMWYGKGPGVDRCGDVFKHMNFAGTSKHGGVLLVAGRRPRRLLVDAAASERSPVLGVDDPRAVSLQRAGIPGAGTARLGDVALLRVRGRASRRWPTRSSRPPRSRPIRSRLQIRLPETSCMPEGGLNCKLSTRSRSACRRASRKR